MQISLGFICKVITVPTEYYDERVCLSATISPELHVRFNLRQIFCRGSVLFRRCCDILCTSGFMVDVMFEHSGQEWATRKAYTQSSPPEGSTGTGRSPISTTALTMPGITAPNKRERVWDNHLRLASVARPAAERMPAGYMFCCCFLFTYLFIYFLFLSISYRSCQTTDLKIYRTEVRQICRVGRTTVVDDQSEISFPIPRGTLPWQPIFVRSVHRNT